MKQLFAACPVLIERDDQLDFLFSASHAAIAGSAQLVVVTGEAGAGKTRLLREFGAALGDSWRHVRIATDSGTPSVSGDPTPYVAADDAPEVAIGVTLTRALEHHLEEGPVLAVLDDLERLDPTGTAAIGAAMDVMATRHVLVVAGLRLGTHGAGSPSARAVADLLRRPFARELSLSPLSVEGVATMARALNRELDGDGAAQLHARTAGNPFFSEEVLSASADAVPWTVTEAVLGRIAALPPASRATAELLAVAVDPVEVALVEQIMSGDEGVVPLLDSGIANRTRDGDLEMRHALVADVVADRLSTSDRRSLHEALARVLATCPDTSPARLARHWHEAGCVAQAARSAEAAGDRAMANRSYRTATDLYRIALEQEEGDPLRNAQLLDRAAVAAGWAGFERDALTWAHAADRAYRLAGETWRAIAMWLSPGLSHVPKPALDHELLAEDTVERLLADARTASRARDYERSAELLRRAMQWARDNGDDHWTIEAAFRLVGVGHVAEGEKVLQHMRASAFAAGNDATTGHALTTLAYVAMARGEMSRALVIDRQALAAMTRRGENASWPQDAGIACLLAYLGDLDGAMSHIARILNADSPLATEFAQYPACLVDLARGDLAAARTRLERMSGVETLGITQLTIGVVWARAHAHYLAGDASTALRLLVDAEDVTGELFEPTRPDRLMLQALAAASIPDAVVLEEVRTSLLQLIALGGGGEIEAALVTVLGLIDGVERRHDQASDRLRDAGERWERSERFIHAATAWCHAAEAAAAAGDHESWKAAMARARAIAAPRGLGALLERLDALAAVEWSPRLHPALERLTAREREIAQHVASGKTNRQIGKTLFISEHTVRNQLVGIYDKLGITRRTELAPLLATTAPKVGSLSGL